MILFRLLQSAKQSCSIEVKPSGNSILVKLLQPLKQSCSIEVKPSGNSILVKLLQPLKHSLFNEVKPTGKEILFKLLQSENVLLVDYQYYTLKTVEKWQNRFCVDTKNVRFNVFNFWLHQNYIDMDWMGAFEPTP